MLIAQRSILGSVTRLSVAAFIVMAAFFFLSCEKEKGGVIEEGKAPDFTLSDINGHSVNLSGLRGKVVLLEFWATWCQPCRDSVPSMNKLYRKFRGRNFELLAVTVDERKDVVDSFAKEHAVAYTILFDDRAVSRLYNVSTIPVMFVIDKEGRIVKKHFGFIPGSDEDLAKEIEAIL